MTPPLVCYEISADINKCRGLVTLNIQKRIHKQLKEHEIEGVTVRIYCPAKTIADCFKYRNKIGLDVALEALRECWREQLCTMEDLWRYAKICRVTNVMRPYLESLT